MRSKIYGASIVLGALLSTAAYAQEVPVSGQIAFAAGGGTVAEGAPVAVTAIKVTIDLPNDDPITPEETITPINQAIIISIDGATPTTQQCLVASCDPDSLTVTLSCVVDESTAEIVVTPGGAGVGGIGDADLAEGQITTLCLSIPPTEPPAASPLKRRR